MAGDPGGSLSPSALRGEAPAGILDELERRRAVITRVGRGKKGRVYLRASTPEGELFGRYGDASYSRTLEHELAARRTVSDGSAIRTPPVLAVGDSWAVEAYIDPEPLEGAEAMDALVTTVAALQDKQVPSAPQQREKNLFQKAKSKLVRTKRTHPLVQEFRHANRVLGRLRAERTLPLVGTHGDLTPSNALLSGRHIWLIDWENSGMDLAGYDLMRLWPFLEREDDRAALFDAALDLVGHDKLGELKTLRYALLVKAMFTKMGLRKDARNADPRAGNRMLRLLAEVRPPSPG